MRRLTLLRHAKSSWDDATLADEDRPLSARGRDAAGRMASYLAAHPIRPDLVVCSPAVRTRETLSLVEGSLGGAEIRFDPELYAFETAALLELLRALEDDRPSVMIVGHNPTIGELAGTLASGGDGLAELRAKYPTGALADLELAIDAWSDVRPGCGHLLAFVRPRDLV
jgi:phosphohistidine phosphatase